MVSGIKIPLHWYLYQKGKIRCPRFSKFEGAVSMTHKSGRYCGIRSLHANISQNFVFEKLFVIESINIHHSFLPSLIMAQKPYHIRRAVRGVKLDPVQPVITWQRNLDAGPNYRARRWFVRHSFTRQKTWCFRKRHWENSLLSRGLRLLST